MFEHLPLMLAQEGEAPVAPVSPAPQQQVAPGVSQAPADPSAQRPAPPGGAFGGNGFFLILMAMLLVMIVMSWRTQSKEKKKRAELLSGLKKGDRIQTVGGIIGSVVEIRDNEVIVKVDENSNTRIRFTRGAIQNILESKDAAAS